METVLKSRSTTVTLSPARPTVLIGENLGAAASSSLADALREDDLGRLRRETEEQVSAGADVLGSNVGAPGFDQVECLPRAVRVILKSVNVPSSIDSADFDALEMALTAYKEFAPNGKPLINSVNREDRYRDAILSMASDYGSAVIGMAADDEGIAETPAMKRSPTNASQIPNKGTRPPCQKVT